MIDKQETKNNPRKNKSLYAVWLSEDEELLLESFKLGINSMAWSILKRVYEREDFLKR